MKICPSCAAGNRDDAAICAYCGTPLATTPYPPAAGEEASRTQPLHRRPVPPGAMNYPPDQTQPAAGPYQQLPYPPAYGQGTPPQAYSPPAYPPPSNPAPQAYYPTPEAYYPPQAYPQAQPRRKPLSRMWMILLGGLGLVMLFACSLAALSLFSASARNRIAGNLPFPSGANPQATAVVILPAEPSPEPTNAPEPTSPPADDQPTLAPDDTPGVEKLLSPECAAALDALQKVGDEVTKNPAAPLSGDWRDEFNMSIANMKTYCGTLDSASPVPGYLAEAQHNLQQASDEFDQANQLFKEGVSELKPGKILDAGKLVQQALSHMSQAIAEIKRIGR